MKVFSGSIHLRIENEGMMCVEEQKRYRVYTDRFPILPKYLNHSAGLISLNDTTNAPNV